MSLGTLFELLPIFKFNIFDWGWSWFCTHFVKSFETSICNTDKEVLEFKLLIWMWTDRAVGVTKLCMDYDVGQTPKECTSKMLDIDWRTSTATEWEQVYTQLTSSKNSCLIYSFKLLLKRSWNESTMFQQHWLLNKPFFISISELIYHSKSSRTSGMTIRWIVQLYNTVHLDVHNPESQFSKGCWY